MTTSPENRRKYILERLRTSGSLSIKEIIADLRVSTMTAHRDAELLERDGLVRRVRGGLALPEKTNTSDRCAMCRRQVPERTRFFFPSDSGELMAACCPHCGLAMVGSRPSSSGSLATDFLYGTTLSASSAIYLVGSRVHLCCSPSVISFETNEDARAFQLGFGGEIFNFSQTCDFLSGKMHSGH
jgi:hypothetical protein